MNIDKFNQQQIDFATQVGDAAKAAGVDPNFAILVLYGETGFNPSAFSEDPKELQEDVNVYVNYLKELAKKYKDPDKTAAAYLAGENSQFLTSGNPEDLDENAQLSFKNIFELGPFPESVLVPQDKDAEDARIAGERRAAQGIGAGAGSLLAAKNLIQDARRGGFPPPKAPPGSPAAGPAAGPTAGPAAAPDVPGGSPASGGRAQVPMGGTAVQNYGKAFGLGDIEASRATDMTKQPGGVHDLTTQRRQGLQRVEELFPNQFREDPRFGGLMTPEQRPGPGPRGPTGQIGGGKPPPIVPPSAPKPGGLERVTQMFSRIAETPAVQSLGKGITRYGGPPAAGFTAFGEGTTAMEEFKRGNYPAATASGLSALGAGLMLVPGGFLPGGALSLAGPAYRTFIEGDESLLPEKFPEKTFLLNTRTR